MYAMAMQMRVKNINVKYASFIPLLLVLTFSSKLSAKEVVVEIYKKAFIPADIRVEKGDTVIWKNIEKRQYHNVWFKQFNTEEPDYFFPGESYQRTFNDTGVFVYECGPHPKMTGTVTVQ
ncbi:cupredoxin domain-containing protein [Thalassotalea castellviae]|uniref:Plastocyanin/azurin family copper-binding protein n=1 Tax=Thalassotalea castellviae TaxID=3075612 RepID=A0ABU2ZYD8_9GAMM|nr:plastocyanin/azurin family copper-binding protein [Thalassotalea sp. W431]MDT0602935.1 plastocyanin/azurin family copper-binding protein [Thalassotalea sp. W431]